MLRFENENSFYFLEVLRRRKENPEMESHAKLIKDFYIYSKEKFEKILPEVRQLCIDNNARAYFRLNVRDAKIIALQFNKRLAELLITQDYKAIRNCYASVVGEFHSDKDKTWVVDLDKEKDCATVSLYKQMLVMDKIVELSGSEQPLAIREILRTANGLHLITKPFRLDKFKEAFPDVDVHKDNPTILFAPE